MLMWWHEIKKGQEPTLLRSDERGDYYAWFKGRGQPYEQADIFSTIRLMEREKDK
jgi:hypothetical protein